MSKKTLLLKSAAALMTTSLVVGAFSYSSEPQEVQSLNLSAIQKATENIRSLRDNSFSSNDVIDLETSNDRIVKVIQGELEKQVDSNKKKQAVAEQAWKKKVKNWEVQTASYLAQKNEAPEAQVDINPEINNEDLIKLYGYESETIKYDSFENVIAEISWPKEELTKEITSDEVSVALSSQEKTTEFDNGDDLVVFDYSSEDAKVDTVSTQSAPQRFSSSVEEAIKREMSKTTTQKKKVAAPVLTFNSETTSKDPLADFINEDATVFDYRAQPTATTAAEEMKKAMASFTENKKNKTIVRAKEIKINQKSHESLTQFEFVPDYERADRVNDAGTGEIVFEYTLAGEMNTQTGILQAQGQIPTRIDLDLNKEIFEVPLLNEDAIQSFLKKEKTNVAGNLIMAKMADEVMDVELDTGYQIKLFLDSSFKVVADASSADYILFLGTKTGNTTLRYLLSNKESAEKIVYVGEGEMFFDDSSFVNTQRELYTLSTRNILGKTVKELNILPEYVKYFGTANLAKKKTLSSYEVKVPNRVENTRKYLELTHLGYSLFIGHGDNTSIEVPANDFVNTVLDAHGMKDLSQRCMIQMNLEKELTDIRVSGKNISGEMFTQVSYLDKEGNFSADNSELAEKVFIVGDQEGQINTKLEYSDGSTEFIKSYCTNGAYFIEQL